MFARRLGPRPAAGPPARGAPRPPSRSRRRCCRSRSGSRSRCTCTRITTPSRGRPCRSGRSRCSSARRWRSRRSRSSRASCSETGLAATPLGALALTAAAVDDVDRLVSARRRARRARLERRVGLRAHPARERAVRRGHRGRRAAAAARACCATRRRRARRSCCPAAFAGAYATEAIGIHAVFGAFLVGAAMPRQGAACRPSTGCGRQLSRAVAVLAPIYFVASGMAVDIPALRASDLAAFALIMAAACAGKFLGAFGGARAAGIGARATRSPSAC